MRTLLLSGSCIALACLFAGCATPPPVAPSVPASLRPPSGSTLYLEALASGVQVYECAARPDSTYGWTFQVPEATLADRAGRVLGKHFAGPAWQANDGSSVAGEILARDQGPTRTAIPWLLLSAKSTSTPGIFFNAKYIQRVATVGGVPPESGCNPLALKRQVRVPYSATYLFYR
jgi:hypothetical protein